MKSTSLLRTPRNSGHLFGEPIVSAIERFHCNFFFRKLRLLHDLFKQECALKHSWFKLLWHSFTQALHAVFYFFFKNIFFASRIFHESCFKAGNCYRPVNHGIVTSTTIPCWSISSLFHLRISQTGTAKNSQMQNRTVRLLFLNVLLLRSFIVFSTKKVIFAWTILYTTK